MNSKKESSLARLLLPFSCLIIILVSVFNIHLSQRVSKLSITVENQENRISSLESLCGRRKYQGYQNIINKAVQKLSISNGYELKVRESGKPGEKSKIIWATKLSDEKKKTKATAKKEGLKGWDRSIESEESRLPANAVEKPLTIENDEHHKIVKRSPKGRSRRNANQDKLKKTCKKHCKKGRRGRKGEKGEKGERGERGEKGDRGSRGPRGYDGRAGKQGPPGNFGPRGPQGEKGATGRDGEKGHVGLPGRDGLQGQMGLQGQAGPRGPIGIRGLKGDKGEDGDAKTAVLIHLVGQTDKNPPVISMQGITSEKDARFTNWKPNDKYGNIDYSDGYIRIKVTGFYYVYCQILFESGSPLKRYIVKNDDKMLMTAKTTWAGRSSLYNGGVFRLNKGSKIWITNSLKNTLYYAKEESSFFGLFLIYEM